MNDLSEFGGIFVAARFAFGSPGGPPALTLAEPITQTGAQTAYLLRATCITPDGVIFQPLASTTPLSIGLPSAAEAITPTSVAGDGASFFATFTAAHGRGSQISSSTFGLQETLNYAALRGGGAVIIDAQWTAIGGTTGIMNAATVPSGVTIQDNRSGGGTGAVDSVFGRAGAVVAAADDYTAAQVTGAVTGVASSVDSELALFNGTGGKTIKRASGTGFAKVVSGVLQTPSAVIPASVLAGASAAAPSTAASTGTLGQIRFESGFLYVCVATDTWQRVAIATW